MTFYAYVRQGEGCDYTIACGETLWKMEAQSRDAAVEELKSRILTYRHGDEIEAADLLEVVSSEQMPVNQWYTDVEAQEREAAANLAEERDHQEYERLKRKFGHM